MVDHHHLVLEQRLEQAPDDHRVGDVGDVHFIEAQQRRLVGDGSRDLGNGIAGMRLAGLGDAVVHLGHELVEMRAALVAVGRRLEEQVHQHGLAAADGPEDVEPLGRRFGARQQGSKPVAPAAPVPQGARQLVEPGDNGSLCGIGLDHAVRDQRAILVDECHGRFG